MTRKETIQELSGKFLQECYEDNLRKLIVYVMKTENGFEMNCRM